MSPTASAFGNFPEEFNKARSRIMNRWIPRSRLFRCFFFKNPNAGKESNVGKLKTYLNVLQERIKYACNPNPDAFANLGKPAADQWGYANVNKMAGFDAITANNIKYYSGIEEAYYHPEKLDTILELGIQKVRKAQEVVKNAMNAGPIWNKPNAENAIKGKRPISPFAKYVIKEGF